MDDIQMFLSLARVLGDHQSLKCTRLTDISSGIWRAKAVDAATSFKRQTPGQLRRNVHNFLTGKASHWGMASMQDAAFPEAQIRDRLRKVLDLVRTHGLRAKAEDFLDRRITLVDQITLPKEVIASKLGAVYKKRILLKEDLANQVAEYAGLQQESPIVRSGVREYYTSVLRRLQQTHWRPDPRGQRIRNMAHEICAQAIDVYPWLNDAEKRILIRATRCFPDDALSFWHHTTLSRLSYLAMGDAASLSETKPTMLLADTAPFKGLGDYTRDLLLD